MSTLITKLTGISLLVDFNYTPRDPETGWGDEVGIDSVSVLTDCEDINILGLLSPFATERIESACRKEARRTGA